MGPGGRGPQQPWNSLATSRLRDEVESGDDEETINEGAAAAGGDRASLSPLGRVDTFAGSWHTM